MMHLPLVKCTASSASRFFLFGHSSKSQHLFSGRIGIISILNSLRVETLLIGSTCPSMSQLFPSASIISWKSWSFSASVESTNWPEGCNELHHHSESLRVSELINPNLKNEHGLMFSEQTKRPHGKPPGGSTARSKTSEFIFKSPWPKHPSFPAVNLWLGALRKGVARCWTYKTTMSSDFEFTNIVSKKIDMFDMAPNAWPNLLQSFWPHTPTLVERKHYMQIAYHANML